MAEALKTFREGEDILASETNENNQFLLSKLSDNAAQVQSYVEGEVATIKSNVASVQATLQENINTLENEKLDAGNVAAYVTKTYKNGVNWYRIYSDGWVEQGGEINGDQYVTFLIPMRDLTYTRWVCGDHQLTASGHNYMYNRSTTGAGIHGYSYTAWGIAGFKA